MHSMQASLASWQQQEAEGTPSGKVVELTRGWLLNDTPAGHWEGMQPIKTLF